MQQRAKQATAAQAALFTAMAMHLYQHMRNVVLVATMRALINLQRDRLNALAHRLAQAKP